MKQIYRYLTLTAVATMLALAQTASAGECCTKAAKQAKEGKVCSKCVGDSACCKKAADVASKESGKECAKCTKKTDKESKKPTA